ncbi:MAG: rhomboid family intramembrane serine protease [Lentimicrobiaceae bacterium]|nr:rhomboid family intramembrane serine protease [Lentimicrobiaceae bacterium]
MQYPTNNPFADVKLFFSRKSVLSQLIIVNVGVYVLVSIVSLFFFLFQINPEATGVSGITKLVYWLAVPADIHSIIAKPWTLITYMFLHENFLHLFFNMIVLYFSGKIFLEYLSERQLLGVYIFGGIAGALVYIVSYNVFPVFSPVLPVSVALGASASVLSILVAIAAYVPQYNVQLIIFGRVKLKYLAIAFVVIDLLSIERENPGGHIAHLGGALWGIVYIYFFLQKPFMSKVPSFSLNKYWNKVFTKKSKLKKVYSGTRPVTDEEYNARRAANQKKMDKVLDKISKSGYNSLTTEEKEFLFWSSNGKR